MKKGLLILALSMIMLTFGAKAQIAVFQEGFESTALPIGWTTMDIDNDGMNWEHSSGYGFMGGHNSDGSYVSYSRDPMYNVPLTPDDWLVTPAITLNGPSTLTFYRMVSYLPMANEADHYAVYVSTTSAADTTAFTLLYEENPMNIEYAWALRTVDLSAYTGETVHIAFRHHGGIGKRVLGLDDITVTSSVVEPLITIIPNGLVFNNVPVGTSSASQTLTVDAYNVSGTVTATVAAPFEVSADNVLFGSVAAVPDTGNTLYVRYSPTAIGTDSTELTVNAGTATAVVNLYGSSIDCGVSLPYSQNFNTTPEFGFPDCWTNPYPFQGYPLVTDDYSDSPGENILMFKCNYNTYEPLYAVLPQMPEDLTSLQMHFTTFREGSWSGTLHVGYVTAPDDTASFVSVWSINAAQIGDNNPHLYQVSFENANIDPTLNYRIAFKYVTGSNWYWFVDDVVVEILAPCSTPSNLNVLSTTSNSVTVGWNGNSQLLYNLYYKTASDTGWTVFQNLAYDTAGLSITGLSPATTYTWYVAALCEDGSEVNSLTTTTFTTDCATFVAPFIENFNAAAALPPCWSRYNGAASDIFAGSSLTPANPTMTTSGWACNNPHIFGNYHLAANIHGTNCYRWVVTPPIDLSALTTPTLTFDLALTKYNNASTIQNPTGQLDDKFMVIVSTDNGATWSAANATVWSNDGNGDFSYNQIPAAGQEFTISLSDYVGQTVMIAFYGESSVTNGDNDIHLDNVVVRNFSTCTKPSNLAVSSVTANSVTLSWTENGTATNWDIEYGPTGFFHGSSAATIVTTSTNPSTISNLSANTYDFYVRANCGDDESLWVGPVTATPGTFSFGITGSDTLTACSLTLYDNGGPNGNYSSNCSYTLVLYPETAGESVGVSGSYTTENNYDYLRIYDGTNTNAPLLGEFCGTGTIPVLMSSFGPLTIEFTSDGGMQYSGFVLNTLCSSCAPAGGLTVDSLTSTSATISWTGMASSYLVEYQAAGDESWISQTTSDTSLALNGLTPHTTYTVRVLADCGDNYSPETTITFTSTMETTPLPYSTDFNAGSDQIWTLNNGSCSSYWAIGAINDSTSALFVTSNGSTAGYNANSISVVTAEKLFTVGDASDLLITFDVQAGGESEFDFLKVFFSPASTEYPASTSNTTNYASVDYQTYAVDFSNYLQYSSYSSHPYKFNLTGGNVIHVSVVMPNPNNNPDDFSTAKLVFLWRNDNNAGSQPGAIIHNVSISPLTCPAPTDLTVTNITTNSASFTWSAGGDEDDWTFEYRPAFGSSWTSVQVTGMAYQLNGLSQGTAYEVRVRANCNSDDHSPWLTMSFTTFCDAISTFPYTEGFEHYGAMPDCWSQEHVNGVLNWTFRTGASNSNSGITTAHSGSYNAFFYETNANGNTTRLVSPVFDLTGVTYPTLSYWHAQKVWGISQDNLQIYYRTSPNDEWHELVQHFTSVEVWTKDSVSLPNPSANYQIAFTGVANYGYGILLDDITISASSSPIATDPTVITMAATDVAQTTATINGTVINPDNVTISAKGFQWKEASAADYTTVNVTGNGLTYNLTGLTAATGYTFRAFITFNGNTSYGNEMTFTTLEQGAEPCDAPTGLHATDIQNHAITIAWDANSSVGSWNVQYRKQGTDSWTDAAANTNSYTVTNLEGRTA
jgi:hypothetical protein